MPAGAAPCDVTVELEIVAWLSVASIDRDCSISLMAAGAARLGTRGGAGNCAGGGPARTARLARLSAPPMSAEVALLADADVLQGRAPRATLGGICRDESHVSTP